MDFSIDRKLKIEDNEEIIKYKFAYDDFLMWPLVRWQILSNSVNNYEENPKKQTIKTKNLLKYSFNVILKYPYFIKNIPIISFGTTLYNLLIDNCYFNRVHDYYNFIFPEDTIFFELPYNFTYKKPRAFKNTYYHDYIRIMPVIKSKFVKNIDSESLNEINAFIDFLKNNFAIRFDDSFYETIKNCLIKEEKRIKHRKKYFLRLIDKIQPKVLFLNCAHYGGESYIIKWAKERGIITAEFQHGVVSKMHPAYNYGEGILNSEEYKKYTPDYFLTYGEYWNNQINIPGKVYVVGNPHFHESIKRYKDIEEEKGTILIVSQPNISDFFIKLALKISKTFPEHKIIYKLHPAEFKQREKYEELEIFNNINIIEDEDIYKLIKKSEYIIGYNSTSLFEAYGFNKKIYVFDDEMSQIYIPESIGIRFKTVEELISLIKNQTLVENTKVNIDYFFNRNWKENYVKFLTKEIGLDI